MEIRVRMEDQVLRVFSRPAARPICLQTRTFFLLWMVWYIAFPAGDRPVASCAIRSGRFTQLAEAAESFWQGRPMPGPAFQPRRREEVRAGRLVAFLRYCANAFGTADRAGTAMLKGVSPDLRTF